jgi:hypothetical protein
VIPGYTFELEQETIDKSWRGANLRVFYPGLFLGELPSAISGSVRLEVGARVSHRASRAISRRGFTRNSSRRAGGV